MHSSFNRRTATKVKNGQVQKKNRSVRTAHLACVIDRESPGRGYRHVVTKSDLQAFIDLIPDWPHLSQNLERIILASPQEGCDAFYLFHFREETGAIYLHALPEDLWVELDPQYFSAHQEIFSQLGVSFDQAEETVTCRFTDNQARAYLLLHVFLHELGHHHHRLGKKHHSSKQDETYAENFANRRFASLFPSYIKIFGDPAKSG